MDGEGGDDPAVTAARIAEQAEAIRARLDELLAALQHRQRTGLRHPAVLPALATAVVGLSALLWWRRRACR
jgi:hypothetical protein